MLNDYISLQLLIFDYFIEGNFEKAVELYSEAIYCKVPKKMKAVYYCNRALVNIKLENYAVALYGIIEYIVFNRIF